MDTQTLLVLILLLLTINILFVGVYIVLVLKEVRGSVIKVNRILDTVGALSLAVSRPIVGLSGAVEGFTEGLKIFKAVKNIKKMARKGSEEEE